MTSQMTATELKATILSVLDEVAAGRSVEITKRGRPVAVLAPIPASAPLRGRYADVARSDLDDEQLFVTDSKWTAE